MRRKTAETAGLTLSINHLPTQLTNPPQRSRIVFTSGCSTRLRLRSSHTSHPDSSNIRPKQRRSRLQRSARSTGPCSVFLGPWFM